VSIQQKTFERTTFLGEKNERNAQGGKNPTAIFHSEEKNFSLKLFPYV